MSKELTILIYGLKDGKDDIRYEQACTLANTTKSSVSKAFEGLVGLELKGYISIEKEGNKPRVVKLK